MQNWAWTTMNRVAANDSERISDHIRHEMGGEMTKRFLRSLPLFKTAEAMPEQFQRLFERMDICERPAARKAGRGF